MFAPSESNRSINFKEADSLMSSVFGLKDVPNIVTVLFETVPFNNIFNCEKQY